MTKQYLDNIVLKCRYYKPTDKYKMGDKNIKRRDFVSCKESYNYLNYIQTGATEKTPKDYEQYIGNREKSCGTFNQNGLLSDNERKELRHQLQTTQSVIWDVVISFREEFGNEYCRDYDQAYEFLKKELPKFFKRAGLISENIVWYAGLHDNTENKHIHLSFFEKEPKYFSNKGELEFHSGKIPKDVLLNSKFVFEKALTNPMAEIIRDRKNLYDKYNCDMDKNKINKKGKRLLLELYNEIPRDGRHGYAAFEMRNVRKKVDDVTDYFLTQNKQTREAYYTFKEDCVEFERWKNNRYFEQESGHIEDVKRRLGNVTINAALEVGQLHRELESLSISDTRYKAMKRVLRKREWDKIFYLWQRIAIEQQKEIDFFMRFHEKMEYYSKCNEYERMKSNYRNRDFEM